jgi:glucosamine-6-phosphate deaminase
MTPDDVSSQRMERVRTVVCQTDREAARQVAARIAALISERNAKNQATVLGLATGHTPIGVYRELVRLHREGQLDFSRVITFNLDEYYPMSPGSIQSYHRWMWSNFFDHVNIPRDAVHIPDGSLPIDKVQKHCEEYERLIRAAGGIDVQILGIGRTGHIGFNEPGSPPNSRTRLITLDDVTRKDAASDFFGEAYVPRQAITMGIGTILEARTLLLLAFGEHKAPVIRRAVEEPVTDAVAASFLQEHRDATVFLDRSAAGDLTRIRTPWLVERVRWHAALEKRAVAWLSQKCARSILRLREADYRAHGLASLGYERGPVDEINLRVHSQLVSVIHDASRLPSGLCILVFSPHPDDDVISVGGTIRKLIARENEVHTAYMTSGNVAVFDHDVVRFAEFVNAFNRHFELAPQQTREMEARVKELLAAKQPGAVDALEVLAIKTLIRWSEARAACRDMGIPDEQIHFLNLPFYQTGQVEKKPITEEDVRICRELIERVRPDWIFFAGEHSDPHGTHRMCGEAVHEALATCHAGRRVQEIWAYRGAWQEWEPQEIDLAVPLSYQDLQVKIFAIFKHQSQKDKALFPGPYDEREFWQRAEARNRETADAFNALGAPEFYALEAFVRAAPQNPA